MTHKFHVSPSTEPPGVHPDRIYPIVGANKKRGIVLLISNVLFTKSENRPGSIHDSHHIIHTFADIGYDVSYHQNMKEQVI